ncbi:TetR family transcriptional regulator [Ancylobacter sp. SL191]|uniref:TetR family transcriptional regulator n=1 Tax=Ancylobacter sp. SL191 TaxID=2995166 RepID=UPI00226F82A3|nr:TetR family transcriptional regulator [Ancylobacter sp. SL191]WAC26522.1 TetR family transcriptional regulator [Ancylobacter sp. SL191]
MADLPKVRISSRKEPKQARSNELVSAILQAAVQVLVQEGARRFTTARVAEKAGVSVGSLYQYFPNKAAILFRLQSDEWRQTTGVMTEILGDAATPPLDRLGRLVRAFILSECEEAALRVALADAAPFYRDAKETREAREAGAQVFDAFMQDALPEASAETRRLAIDLITTAMSAAGKQFSSTPRNTAEIDAYAAGLTRMFCAYLRDLQQN